MVPTARPTPALTTGEPQFADDLVIAVREHLGLRLWRENGQVVVEVTDSGPGLPEEVLPHVFGI